MDTLTQSGPGTSIGSESPRPIRIGFPICKNCPHIISAPLGVNLSPDSAKKLGGCAFKGLRRHPPSEAFTLIEILTVVVTASLVTAIMVPAIGGGIRRSREVKCLANLRQLQTAWYLFANDNDGRLCSSGPKNSKDNDQYPGLLEYVGLKINHPNPYFATAFTCPQLQADPDTATKEGFYRTYSINFMLTDPTWPTPNATLASGQRSRLAAIRNPSRVALFMDGALDPARPPTDRYAQSIRNDKGSGVLNMLQKPHDGHSCVVYADGHAGRTPVEAFTDQTATSLFWRDSGN
jgi:type II secretory pathway pseudopilin PulG